MKKIILLIVTTAILVIGCGKKIEELKIASKNFTENIILAEIMGALIDAKTNIKVNVMSNFGSTFVIHKAMQSNEIDMYPDYTGTLYQTVLKKNDIVNSEESLRIVKEGMLKEYNQVILDSFGFNNTYAMGVLKEKADKYNLTKISDLKQYPKLIAGFDSEFIDRADGGRKMLEAYGIKLNKDIVQLEIGLKYQAIVENKSDFTDVFTTDSKIKRFEMTILEDDKKFFPEYYALPVIRKEVVDKYPELVSVLSVLTNSINEKEMVNLNFEVEENKRDAKEVALEFLKSKNFI